MPPDKIPDGIIVIDKPGGLSSMDVVRRIRRAARVKRVGHGGTLDPMATGVIPICVGRATRLLEYVLDSSKEYAAEIRLGIETDTYDAEGEVVSKKDPSPVTRRQVEDALGAFLGDIEQVPPMYSALKRGGERLYELARRGIEVERPPRPVIVHRIELTDWNPPVASVTIECGSGFYVRSLAHDLGKALGCGAHLTSLARLKAGGFRIGDAWRLDSAESALEGGRWEGLILPPDAALPDMPSITLGEDERKMARNGRPLPSGPDLPPASEGEIRRAYAETGEFLAIMRFDSDRDSWLPHKVFDSG